MESGGLSISRAPEVPLTTARSGLHLVAVLGHLVDTGTWASSEAAVTLAAAALARSEREFLDATDAWSGRYLVIFGDGSSKHVMTDASGMRSAFYSPRGAVRPRVPCHPGGDRSRRAPSRAYVDAYRRPSSIVAHAEPGHAHAGPIDAMVGDRLPHGEPGAERRDASAPTDLPARSTRMTDPVRSGRPRRSTTARSAREPWSTQAGASRSPSRPASTAG